jgi:acetyl coenzyme A synthetase (ADP forming)-like protein
MGGSCEMSRERLFRHPIRDIDVFLYPESIAVVGASPRPGSVGRVIVENLIASFKGKIYPVNPRHNEILGLKSYPSLKDLPETPDLAVVAVRAEKVPGIVEEAVDIGVPGVIVISGGFAEAGPKGRELQERLKNIISGSKTRLLGPNCIGVYNALSGVDTFFLPKDRMKRPHKGPIAIISQSGAFLASIMDWAAEEGIGISMAINFGNKIDVDEVDFIEYFIHEEKIKTIIMYLESINPGRGRAFIEASRRATEAGKSLLVLKVGRTSAGAAAAASHTAALAGDYAVYKAAFKQARVIEVEEPIQLFDMAKALVRLTPPRGRRVGIITNAGGPGVIAADRLAELGLIVPRFSEKLKAELRKHFPERVAVGNPVDLTGDATPEDFKKALDIVIESGEIDMLMVLALMQPPTMHEKVADIIADTAWRHRDKPIVTVTIGSEYAKRMRDYLENRGIPVYDFPDRAANALYALARCIECRWGARTCEETYETLEAVVPANAKERVAPIIHEALERGGGKLLEHEAFEVLEAYGLPVPRYCLATSEADVGRCMEHVGTPAVAKIVSPDVIHKSDVGGVILGLESIDDGVKAFRKIKENLSKNMPNARFYGVLYQHMVPSGLEVIVGAKRDPVFGVVLLFGLGGVFVELLKDVSIRVAPINPCEALDMTLDIKGRRLLEGYRGTPPRDRRALAGVILKIARLMLDIPQVRELDLNPVMSYERGAAVADARIIVERGRP